MEHNQVLCKMSLSCWADEGCKMYKSHLLVDFWTSSVSWRCIARLQLVDFVCRNIRKCTLFSVCLNLLWWMQSSFFSLSLVQFHPYLFYCPRTTTPVDNPVSGYTKMGEVLDDFVKILISYNIEINTREWETKLVLIPSLKDKVSISYN